MRTGKQNVRQVGGQWLELRSQRHRPAVGEAAWRVWFVFRRCRARSLAGGPSQQSAADEQVLGLGDPAQSGSPILSAPPC